MINDHEPEHPMRGVPVQIRITGSGNWEQVLEALRKLTMSMEDKRTRLTDEVVWEDPILLTELAPMEGAEV